MTSSRPARGRRRDVPPPYPVEPWTVREVGFEPANAARNATVFALANGHLGLRGDLEEDVWSDARGTYLNGFHEVAPISYGEAAFGYARNHQVLLSIADGRGVRLEVGGEPLDLATGRVEQHERTLDLRDGILTRRLRWRSPAGVLVDVTARRLVSLTRRSVAAIEYEVAIREAPPEGVEVRLVSALDARVENRAASDDPRAGSRLPSGSLRLVHCQADGAGGVLVQRTRLTRMAVAVAMRHRTWLSRGASAARLAPGLEAGPDGSAAASDEGIVTTFGARLGAGDRMGILKLLGYRSSLDAGEDLLASEATVLADGAAEDGFGVLAREQAGVLRDFWRASDVQLDGDLELQQGVRYNLFSIFQSAGRDGRTSLAAKGLTGDGYDGHYFWDTEVFALPFLAYTQPAIARAVLCFRISTLPQARARAAEMSEPGALYPWRTINGDEASAYFPAGTAQYHINADIALALVRYVRVTGDRSLLLEGGAELLVETARMWLGLGAYIPSRDGAFCINEVTGPDEYTALVNNNAFTNLMARAHLRQAARVAAELAQDEPVAWAGITARLGLGEHEVAEWRRAADHMRIPRDNALGVHAQDDSFLDRERWDFAGTPQENFPLLLHYHPLVIYRHQVLKQSDVVLAQVLLSHDFTRAEKRRNYDYYDPLTTGDSSLSPCIQSVAAAELGYAEAAYRHFLHTARMDLDDVNGNTDDGVHIAAMAGSWVSIVYGFAGLRDDDGRLSFAPRVPARWRRLAFRLRIGPSTLRVALTPDEAVYEVERGGPVELRHFGELVSVKPGAPSARDLRPTIRAVIFDLDGVLTDTAELHFRAWRRLAAEESVPFDRQLNERLKGVSRTESLEIILDHAGRTIDDSRERLRLAERKNAYFRELVARITPADLLPGVDALLAELRAAGVRTAIASMSRNAPEVIRRLGIEGAVDAIVDPASLVKGKPDPEIFLAAAEMLGVRPDDCVGIEDARAGVEAIIAAGMVAVGVGDELPGADWVVPEPSGITVTRLTSLVRERRRA